MDQLAFTTRIRIRICQISLILIVCFVSCLFRKVWRFSYVLNLAIRAFWLHLDLLIFEIFVKLLERRTVKEGLNVFSYFPA